LGFIFFFPFCSEWEYWIIYCWLIWFSNWSSLLNPYQKSRCWWLACCEHYIQSNCDLTTRFWNQYVIHNFSLIVFSLYLLAIYFSVPFFTFPLLCCVFQEPKNHGFESFSEQLRSIDKDTIRQDTTTQNNIWYICKHVLIITRFHNKNVHIFLLRKN